MSYDLSFWKYQNKVKLDHQDTYEKCSNGQRVEGLENLPIESIIKEITKAFAHWKKDKNSNLFENTQGGAFEIFHTTQFIRFDCYGVKGEDMNKMIDVLLKYNCPLYDPQVPERYD